MVTENSPGRRVTYRELLSNRNFLSLWSGSLIGRTGDYLLSIAMIWFAYQLTSSALYTGIVTAAFYMPVFIFAPVIGSVIDMSERRRVIVSASLAEMAVGSILFYSITYHFLEIIMVVACIFSIATFGLVVSVARTSTIPLVVSRDDITSANSLQQTSTQMARIVGYSVGGVLLLLLRVQGIVLVDVAAFAVSAAILSRLHVVSHAGEARKRSVFDGLRYIRHNSLFLGLIIYLAVSNFTGASMLFLPAIMSQKIFHAGSGGYASILIMLAAGTIAGGYAASFYEVRKRAGKIIIECILVSAFLFVAFAYAGTLAIALVVTAGLGILEGFAAVPFAAMLQSRAPHEIIGSVLASVSMILMIGASASMISGGFIVEFLGVQNVYLLYALLLIAISVVAWGIRVIREAEY